MTSPPNSSRILVTGGSGFLGSHVADALSKSGFNVTILDTRPSPYLRNDQEMAIGDILDLPYLENLLLKFDYVYHFAGIADIDECATRPVDTVKFNVLGTVNLLEASRKAHIKRFIFGSSAYVYSQSGGCYRSSKQACESFIENFNDLYGLKFTCVRYGSLYGPRSDTRNSVYRMIQQALGERRITYHGTGEELREFIHVFDAAEISRDLLKPEFENQHITVTGNEKMRYRDLLLMLKEMFKQDITIEILPSHRSAHYNITPYTFNPRLGKKVINNPHIDMGQGLLQCISEQYYRMHPDQSDKGTTEQNGG